MGTLFKMNPPLRTAADQAALRCALADGAIDAIATDHAPHSDERKELPLDQAAPGMTGLETSLAAALTDVVEPGFASFETIIAAMTWQPARIAGLDQWGHGGPLNQVLQRISRSWMPARCGPWTRPGWRVGHPTTRTAVGNYAGESSIPSSAALRPGPPANGWSQLARSSRSLSIDPMRAILHRAPRSTRVPLTRHRTGRQPLCSASSRCPTERAVASTKTAAGPLSTTTSIGS